MRRDVFHIYPARIDMVYNAYKRAAVEKFGKNPECKPYNTIVYGLNFSMKYNMNGGGLHIHLKPMQGSTAVALRFSVAQAVGARYGAYDRDMTLYVESILGVKSTPASLNINDFIQSKSGN